MPFALHKNSKMIIIPEIKLTFKNLLKIIGVSCFLIIAGYFVVYWCVIDMSSYAHRDEIELVKKEIKNGLNYPKNFEKIMNKLKPTEKYIKTKSIFHDKVFATILGANKFFRTKKFSLYYSEDIIEIVNKNQLSVRRWTNIFDEKMLFAIGLEKELSAKEIEAFYFLNKTINLKVGEGEYKRLTGLEEVALERFGKDVDKLEKIELVELFVLMDIYGAFYQENEAYLKKRIRVHLHILEREIKN
jgi:hypothetical protein